MVSLFSITNLIALFAIILFIIYWLHTFVILYHLIRFGVGTRPKQAALIFFGGSFGLFFLMMMTVLAVIFLPQ
jgi:hypothetical protein